MITKAKIQSLDSSGSTCTVRIPYFESASISDQAILEATFSTLPGVYNGYKVDDTVLVAFEDGLPHNPVVIGKLYLGIGTESKDPRGSINCINLNSTASGAIPLDTKLISTHADASAATSKTATNYKSIKDIIDKLGNSTQTEYISNNIQNTVICKGPCTNIYGYTAPGFSYIKDNLIYYITYDNNITFDEGIAKQYMKFMTGQETLPIVDQTIGGIVFETYDRRIYYPSWDDENKTLQLITIVKESLEETIKRIIEEYASPVTVTDISGENESLVTGLGVTTEDASTEEHATHSSTKVEIEDLSRDEEN